MKKTFYVSFQEGGPKIYVEQLPPANFPFIKNPDLSKAEGIVMDDWHEGLFKETKVRRLSRLHRAKVISAILGSVVGALITLIAIRFL